MPDGRVLHSILDEVAAVSPDRPAVLWREESLTFADLSARSRATRDLVLALTDTGEQVAVIGDNHPAWIDAYYGVPRAGRVLTFLNHRLAPAEIAEAIRRAGAVVLVGDDAQLDRLAGVLADLPEVRTVLPFSRWSATLAVRAGDDIPDLDAVDPSATAWLLFTSGTTAKPKGAELTPAGLLAALAATAAGRAMRPDDVYVFPFPLCHVAGYNVLLHHAAGRPVVLLDRFDAVAFVDAVASHGATSTSLAATMLAALLDHLDEHPADVARLATLRTVAYGAAPMPARLLRRAHDVLGVEFSQGYGMTELSGNAVFLGPADHVRGLDGDTRLLKAAGRASPGVELRIVDERGTDVAPGHEGEILVRAPQLLARYWRDPETTAAAFAGGGWFRTGDVGSIEGDLLSIVDRKKDVIISGGENISSLEVEEAVLRCADVAEVAVVAAPDERWGEVVVAFVVARAGATIDPEAVRATVRDSLAGFKVPKRVLAIDALPKNGTGKVVKAELRERLQTAPRS